MCYVIWQRNFIDVVKYLEMAKLPWIIQVNPKCNHKYSHKTDAKEN